MLQNFANMLVDYPWACEFHNFEGRMVDEVARGFDDVIDSVESPPDHLSVLE